jgi:enoyl-CoA hydratase/carnithine racemase
MKNPVDFLSDEILVVEISNRTAWMRFNRPDQLNCFTPELYRSIKDAVRVAEHNDDVDTIVFTGTGRSFATGGDLKEVLARITDADPLPWFEFVDACPFDAIKSCRKTVISAVNGLCYAAGLLITLMSDISIGAESATFAFPETRVGFAESFSVACLAGRVSWSKAKYMLYTGLPVSSQEAERIGLITEVVPDDQLFNRVDEVIKELRDSSFEAQMLFKEYINRLTPPLEWPDLFRGLSTSDAVAFLEKFKARGTNEEGISEKAAS